MNTYQEALEKLRLLDCVDEENFEIKFEILPTLQELVDKATPKKPNLLPTLHAFNGSEIEQQVELIECSCCEFCLKPSDKFCSNCGTEIDWNEE